jgi:hypothetical protein
MLTFLARCALRLASIAIPLIALAFVVGAPALAKADVCMPFLTAAFPTIPNGVTHIATAGDVHVH